MKAGYLTFCDRSSGVLKKQDDTGVGYNETMLTVYGSTNCMNIPLVGLFDRERGDSMMLQIESPLDANVRLSRKAGLIWPEPVWQCRMGVFAYSRRATYRFIEKGGYVKMAELYREYQRERGMLKTLTQKAKERPMVSRMKGAPILWAEANDVEFLKKWRNFGITRAILASESSSVENQRRNDMGYITLGYDSYGDITEGPLGFQSDGISGKWPNVAHRRNDDRVDYEGSWWKCDQAVLFAFIFQVSQRGHGLQPMPHRRCEPDRQFH